VLGALAVVGLSATGVAAIELSHGSAAAVGASSDEPTDTPSAPVVPGGRGRQQLTADDGAFTVRLLVPDPIVAGTRVGFHVQIWNKLGTPLAAPELVLTLEDPHGLAKGFSAHAHGHEAGHYGLATSFAEAGHYVVRIFPPDSDSVLELALDVK
jgi:hypothetical protein